jgi:beta-galactosidase
MIEHLEGRFLFAVGEPYVVPTDPRVRMDLSATWKFFRADVALAPSTSFNDSAWGTVSLPHTWNNLDGQDGGNDYYRGIGWYRKTITVPSSFSGKSVFIQFDGSSIATDVYIDGSLVGTHSGSFAAFNFDVTSRLLPGTHLIAVKVSNAKALSSTVPPKDGDFTIGGGMYRGVSLIGMDKRHVAVDDFASPGVQLSTPSVSSSLATAQIKTRLQNVSQSTKTMVVKTRVVDQSGIIVAEAIDSQVVNPGAAWDLLQNTSIANPHLWNGRLDPYLHNLYIEVRDATTNQLYDFVKQRIGIRSYQISPTQGFLLNGESYDLHGVSMHQDRLNKGWAISNADIQQDISLVLEIGATMLRTAHYQQSQLVYDLADENGLIVWTEAPLVNSAAPELATSAQQQLKELIRQNFNHPSIVVWGLYNEIFDDLNGQNMVSSLNALAHAEDSTRLTTGASHHDPLATLEGIPDAVGLNRYHGWYYGVPGDLGPMLDTAHASFPALPIGVSEFGAGGSIYQHQDQPTTVVPFGYYHPEEFQNYFHEQTWPILATRSYLWSKLVWNMFDFAADHRGEGDSFGRNDKGLITYDRATKKDAFYYYKSNWSDSPTIHITSGRWMNRVTADTEVKVYSNLDNVQLSVNGASLGAMSADLYHTLRESITLLPGNNIITVTGEQNGQSFSDSVTWTYAPPLPIAAGTGATKINFSPSDTGVMPAGYAIDSGAVFGTRSNGKKYGWATTNNTTRRRGINADPRYDTLIHLQKDGAFHTWEYELANGVYDVFLAAGDPTNLDSVQSFNVEGKEVSDLNGLTNGDEHEVRVVVSDGRLTVKPGLGAVNSKLQFVEFSSVTDTTPPVVTSSSFSFETGYQSRVTFDEAIDPASLSAGDLTWQNESDGSIIGAASVTYDPGTRTATFVFDDPADGDFRATLLPGSVCDLAGNYISSNFYSASFFILAADANRDRKVDTWDFNTLASQFGQTGKLFSEGNFNQDSSGIVDSTDFLVLISSFGKRLG